jgi:hypothetical protein
MIGAMYENGGNTTHRLLDGHPQLYVYPFESQLGTRLVQDMLTSLFPVKYRWPVFDLESSPFADYKAIIDEECKVRARTAHVSKFRDMPFDFSDDARCEIYRNYIRQRGKSRANNVASFFQSTFDAWKDYNRTGREQVYVGYSPILAVDAEKVLTDFPEAHFLHVVRNPWSAYADTKKRPVPLSLQDYMLGWTLNQYYALVAAERNPERFHILRFEDIISSPGRALGSICAKLKLDTPKSLEIPTFNSIPLKAVYPWGTIRIAEPGANRAAAEELAPAERVEVRLRALHYLGAFDYKSFLA